MENMVIEVVKDAQGNVMKIYNSFTYTKQNRYKQNKKWTKWSCVKEHLNCKGTLLIFRSRKKLPELVTGHNHPPHSVTNNGHLALDGAGLGTSEDPDNSSSLVTPCLLYTSRCV